MPSQSGNQINRAIAKGVKALYHLTDYHEVGSCISLKYMFSDMSNHRENIYIPIIFTENQGMIRKARKAAVKHPANA